MVPPKRRILPHSPAAIDRLLRHRWAATVVGSVSLLGMVAAFAIAPVAEPPRSDLQTVLERLSPPATTLLDTGNLPFLREERVRRGDTVASLLIRLGIHDNEALTFLRSDRQGQRVAQQLRPGSTVTTMAGASGELHALQVPLPDEDSIWVVERRGTGFVAHEQRMEFAVRTVARTGELRRSRFGAGGEAGIPDAIADQLTELFGSEIDFYRDRQQGGRFSLLYETLYHQGQAVRSGRLLAATITLGRPQKVLQAYWFQPEKGEGAYYTADGSSLSKAFLPSPIKFAPVTSGFSDSRLHPILQVWRAHQGVDYAAPTGTPVLAVADGIVEAADHQNGYGNLLVVRHAGSYSTAYGHLDAFAAGIRPGARVRQGEVIGTVGQTGLATGPHLHYEFRVNDQSVDPLTLDLPRSMPLAGVQRAHYLAARLALEAQLELAVETRLAARE
ncbi:MAG: peptidoglycan DD-metalloendopeptidase family protein [Candidatus Accumulibacter sp. UW26]|jgi:murein DD-endopeptidase MepM/ murein hydrolase activator NlpD